jgi:hypothetical protein
MSDEMMLMVSRRELPGELREPRLAHPYREQQVDLLGVRRDRSRERRGVDAEGVSRRQQHVVETVPICRDDDVTAVFPRARERRIRDTQELVVVVAERAEP